MHKFSVLVVLVLAISLSVIACTPVVPTTSVPDDSASPTAELPLTPGEPVAEPEPKPDLAPLATKEAKEEEPASPKSADYVTVLMYHHLAPQPDPKHYGLIIDPEEFAAHMAYLKEHDYYTPTLQELADFVQNNAALPPRSVVITFDDGYESNYTYAFPILQQHGLRGVIFPIGQEIRLAGAAPGWHSYLTDIQMQEMQASGVIEFGSHTYAMHGSYQGSPFLQVAALEQIVTDLQEGEELFAALGLPQSIAIAYPFGKYGVQALEACQAVGYQIAFTTEPGRVYANSSPLQLPRKRVSGGLTLKQFADIVE